MPSRRRHGISSLLSVTAMVMLANGVAGQERDTTSNQDTVRLAPVFVTATRVPVRLDRLGVASSIISSEDLRMRPPSSAAEALRYVGGAFIDEANGPGGPTIVRLRGGEEVFTQILVDGVQVNQNGGFFDFLGFAPGNLERIEIARGPQSALYGSSAMSGVVQFLTRRGDVGPPRMLLAGEGSAASENGGGHRFQGEISGGSRALRYAAGAGYRYSRGIYALPNDAKTSDASLRLDASPSDVFALAGTFRYMSIESMLPVRDPGATRVPLDPNASNTRDRIVASLGATFAPTSSWRHELRGTLYRDNFVYDDVGDGLAAELPALPFFVFDATFRLDSRLVRKGIEYSGDYRAGGNDDFVLSWGVRGERETLRDRTSGDFGDDRQTYDRNSTAVFGEMIVRPVRWLDLVAGVRAEKYDGLDVAVTPRGSARLQLVPGRLALRLAAGRAYKAPNLQEQYPNNPFIVSNPDLAPETSVSVEAGVDATTADGRVDAGVTVFHQTYDDLVRAVQYDATRQQNRNLGRSRANGVEARLRVEPAARWALGLEGSWIRTRIVDATGLPPGNFPEGEELPFRPSVVGEAFVEFTPTDPFTVRVRASHVGEQIVLSERFSGDRVPIDAYTLAGLDLTWSVTSNWMLYARFDNLFDTAYETAFDRRGIPATAAIGLHWRN